MYKACIFDLDGTLLNTLDTVIYYANQCLAKFGFGQISMEQCRALCRLTVKEYYSRLLEMGGCPTDKVESYIDPIREYDLGNYGGDPMYLTRPYEGVQELLIELQQKGILLAVLTNKPDSLAQPIVSANFSGRFQLCVGQTMTSIAKPDPRALWNVIDSLALPREACLYVGDTDVDLITANRAEIACVAAGWGYSTHEELKEHSPMAIAQSPLDLLAYFK